MRPRILSPPTHETHGEQVVSSPTVQSVPRQGSSLVSQGPARSFEPALCVWQVIGPVQTHHPLPIVFRKCSDQSPFRFLVPHAGTRIDRHSGDPASEKVGTAPGYHENGALPPYVAASGISEPLVRGQGKKAAAVAEPVELRIRGPRCARVHVDYIGGLERDRRTVAMDNVDVWVAHEILLGAGRQIGLELYRGDATG